MAFKINALLKNAVVDTLITNIAGTTGTGGTATISLYTGSQPASADAATSGTLLATLVNVSWAASTNGTAALTGAFAGTVLVGGTAGWARFQAIGGDGTFVMDGDVGTGATTNFVIDNPDFSSAGVLVFLQSGSLSVG